MVEYIDFFNVYIMGSIEMLFQFYFFAKILKKKVKLPFYFLFAVCAVFVTDFVSVGLFFCLQYVGRWSAMRILSLRFYMRR